MSGTTCEKLVKYTIKSVSKKYGIDYDELKKVLKKVVKTAQSYDESIFGMMEEIMDLGSVGSIEELEDFNIDVLKVYCKIKEIDIDGISERHIRSRVWKHIESEFELDDDDDEDDDSEDDSEEESEDDSEEESEEEEEEIKPVKKSKKKVTIKSEPEEEVVE